MRTCSSTVVGLFCVNHRPCGTLAIRSRITGILLSDGLFATHRAALVCGST